MNSLDPFYNPVIPDHVPPELVHDYWHYNPAVGGGELFQSIRHLHEQGAPDIFWSRHSGGHWVARRGGIIAEILNDPATFSSRKFLVPADQNFDTDFFVPLMADPPEHGKYRALAAPLFLPGRIKALEEDVRRLTGELIDEVLPRGGCEFMSEFALQMPIIVFLGLLDLPLEDRPRLLKISERIVRPPEAGERRGDAMQEVFDYLIPIIEARLAEPGGDVLSKLVTGLYDGKPLEMPQMLGLAATILVGGLDTVATMLGFVVRYLAENPQARADLADGPLRTSAIEEMLRRLSSTTHARRISQDVTFHGVAMHKDDRIAWNSALFNLDEAEFDDPMSMRLDRKPNRHVTFGQGPHFCPGAHLTKLEIGIFISEWLKRIPDFAIEAGKPIRYRPGIVISHETLPLFWPV